MQQLWMRAGVSLTLTGEEAEAILAPGASSEAIEEVVKKIILGGRFRFDGSSYIPQCCVEQYNEDYGTDYEADDIDFEVNINTGFVAKAAGTDAQYRFTKDVLPAKEGAV